MSLYKPVVRLEVRKSKGLTREGLTWLHDVHLCGGPFLEPPNQVGVKAELQDRCTTGILRELRVDHFVGPCAQGARLGNAQKDIGPTAPSPVAWRSLNDGVGTGLHSRECSIDRGFTVDVSQLNYIEALRAQVLNIGLLMGQTALLEKLKRRIPPGWTGLSAFGDSAIEFREVTASKVVGEVRGGEEEA